MPGPTVGLGTQVLLTPGLSGPPDSGVILVVFQTAMLVNGLPAATSGSLCLMVNSVLGFPYFMPIGSPASTGVTVTGTSLVRAGDRIPTPPGIMLVGPPTGSPIVVDQSAP